MDSNQDKATGCIDSCKINLKMHVFRFVGRETDEMGMRLGETEKVEPNPQLRPQL